jgi:hypothetical protein
MKSTNFSLTTLILLIRFESKNELDRHKQDKHGAKGRSEVAGTYICPVLGCEKKYTFQSGLRKHKNKIHPELSGTTKEYLTKEDILAAMSERAQKLASQAIQVDIV